MFYEFKHSLSADYFSIETGVDFEYPAHLHHCFELLCVTEGEMHVEVDELKYDLREGDALMIFSNQIHSMKTSEHSKHILCLFSPKLISAYSEMTASAVPVDNYFRPDRFYIDKLSTFSKKTSNIELKGLLYSLCGEFDAGATYREANAGSNILLFNIFKFIEQNYNKNCALTNLAKSTGYDYAYLSRYFKKSVGISYNDYVNQYRISKACYLLQNNEMTVLEISNECGFNSLRSLNRNFKEQLGMPPAEYRKQLREHSASNTYAP
ncbi:MAG: helix-turn-helix domain-containing protein [Eubacteriales bacterium]